MAACVVFIRRANCSWVSPARLRASIKAATSENSFPALHIHAGNSNPLFTFYANQHEFGSWAYLLCALQC
jgi:hypothetical protein